MGAVPAVRTFDIGRRFNCSNNRQTVSLSECVVTLILARYRHDGAGAVGSKDVVGDVHRNLFSVEGVNNVTSGKGPALIETGPSIT